MDDDIIEMKFAPVQFERSLMEQMLEKFVSHNFVLLRGYDRGVTDFPIYAFYQNSDSGFCEWEEIFEADPKILSKLMIRFLWRGIREREVLWEVNIESNKIVRMRLIAALRYHLRQSDPDELAFETDLENTVGQLHRILSADLTEGWNEGEWEIGLGPTFRIAATDSYTIAEYFAKQRALGNLR